MNYATRGMDESKALAFLDDAENHDLYVLFHFNKSFLINGEIDKILELNEALKDHPALYAWYLSDEPGLQRILKAVVKQAYENTNELDPNNPIFISTWYIKRFHTGAQKF